MTIPFTPEQPIYTTSDALGDAVENLGNEDIVDRPPELERTTERTVFMIATPIIVIAVVVAIIIMLIKLKIQSGVLLGAGAGVGGIGGIYLFSMMRRLFSNNGKKNNENLETAKDYLDHLDHKQDLLNEANKKYYKDLQEKHPDYYNMLASIGGDTMWTSKPGVSHSFMDLRMGVGNIEPPRKVTADIKDINDVTMMEPASWASMNRFLQANSIIRNAPLRINLRSTPAITVHGEKAKDWVRSLLISIMFWNEPKNAPIICFTDKPEDWDGLKWAPHALHPESYDKLGNQRLTTSDWDTFVEWVTFFRTGHTTFDQQFNPRSKHVTLIIDSKEKVEWKDIILPGGMFGITIIDINPPSIKELHEMMKVLDINVTEKVLSQRELIPGYRSSGVQYTPHCKPDLLKLWEFNTFIKKIAPYRSQEGRTVTRAGKKNYYGEPYWEMLGIEDPYNIDLQKFQAKKKWKEMLQFPLGWEEATKQRWIFNGRQQSDGGSGPHMIGSGMTGSGKSEFLKAMHLGILLHHDPEQVNVMTLDFKGNATFKKTKNTRHTQIQVDNLGEDQATLYRAILAIRGNIIRKQRIFANLNTEEFKVENLDDYWKYREAHPELNLEPIPLNIIIVDELQQGLKYNKNLMELFVDTAAIGRTTGDYMHLYTQSGSTFNNEIIKDNITTRIALRAATAAGSNSLIGTPDAYDKLGLPPNLSEEETKKYAGRAMVKTSTDLRQIKFAYSDEYFVKGKKREKSVRTKDSRDHFPARPYTNEVYDRDDLIITESDDIYETTEGEAFGSIVIRQLNGPLPEAVHKIYQPPLGPKPISTTGGQKLTSHSQINIGIIDDPFNHSQEPFILNVLENTYLNGASRSGISTAIQTMIMTTATQFSSSEIAFMCLDSGRSLLNLKPLPHVIDVATINEVEKCQNVVHTLEKLMQTRSEIMSKHGINNIFEYLANKPEPQNDPYGMVILVMDTFGVLFDKIANQMEPVGAIIRHKLQNIAATGPKTGINLWAGDRSLKNKDERTGSTMTQLVFLNNPDAGVEQNWPTSTHPYKDPYFDLKPLDNRTAKYPFLNPGWIIYPRPVKTSGGNGVSLFGLINLPVNSIDEQVPYEQRLADSVKQLASRPNQKTYPQIPQLQPKFDYVANNINEIVFAQASFPPGLIGGNPLEEAGMVYATEAANGKTNFLNVVLKELAAKTPNSVIWVFNPKRRNLHVPANLTNARVASGRNPCEQQMKEYLQWVETKTTPTKYYMIIDNYDQLPDHQDPMMFRREVVGESKLAQEVKFYEERGLYLILTIQPAKAATNPLIAEIQSNKGVMLVGKGDRMVRLANLNNIAFDSAAIPGRVTVVKDGYPKAAQILYTPETETKEEGAITHGDQPFGGGV